MDERLLEIVRQGSRPMRPLPAGVKETGRLPREPRAVLFDVYGTLLVRVGDVHPWPERKRQAIEAVAREHSLSITPSRLQELLRQRISERHAVMRAQGVTHPEIDIESVWADLFPRRAAEEIRTMIVRYELAAHPCWPMPGARRLMSFLSRRGIALGIVSNAQFYTPLFLRALLGADLEALGFAPDLCVFSFDLGAAKPDLSLFKRAGEALRRRSIMPDETVMAGNSAAEDAVPAARAGFMTVLAALDRRSLAAPGDGARGGPDAVIATLASLRRLFPEHVQQPGL